MAWKPLDIARSTLLHWKQKTRLVPSDLMVTGVVIVVLIVVVMWFSLGYGQTDGNEISRREVVRNVAIVIALTIALSFGIWRVLHTVAAERGLFTDRFSMAVKHLGSKKLPVRLGGIFALWRLEEDSPARGKKMVWDIMSAFVRTPAHTPAYQLSLANQPELEFGETARIRTDVQAILDFFKTGAAALQREEEHYVLNFSQAKLCEAKLSGAHFNAANLNGANLNGADLGTGRYWPTRM